MKLDPRTIIFLIILGSMLMSVGMFAVARGYLGQVRGLSQWARATAIQVVGWIVIGVLRGAIPDVVSIVLGNCLIQVSLVMYLLILADFNDRPIRSVLPYSLVAISGGLLFYYSAFDNDLTKRQVVISIVACMLMLKSVQVLWHRREVRHASHTFTASLFALCGSFMALRALYYLIASPDPHLDPYGQNMANDLAYVVYYVTALLLTFGFVLMCNDRYISQQKNAEQALQANHHLLTKLSAQVPGAIYQFQLFPDGRMCFPFASDGIRQIYEVEPEQVRESAAIVHDRISPEDVDKVTQSIMLSAEMMQVWQLEYRVILPVQGLRWRLGHAQPERLPDGSILWHGYISDITERALAREKQQQLEAEVRAGYEALKASEQRLRRVMNSSLIGMVQGDATGALKETNDVLLSMSGYSREEFISGATGWFDLIPESELAQQIQTIRNVAAHEVIAPFESEIRVKDGSIIPIMLGLSSLEGSESEWVGFVLDLREQRRIDTLKSEFISVVSHELRTPLTSIKGSLGLLEGGIAGALPEKALHLIKIAHKNSQRLVSLVNDILDMEKLASGKMTLHMQKLNLTSLAVQSVEANASYAANFKVRYQMGDHPEQAPVMGDSDRLMQVFANLLSNAAKFSPAGGQVDLRIIETECAYRVEVEDHGSGIPLEFRERIFGKFAQADGTSTRQLEGAGLGLNITKSLIENMGGEIGFTSEEGVATVFWFSLPRCQEHT